MNRSLRQALAAGAVALCSLVAAVAASGRAAAPTITALEVSGSSSRPVFTVTGHGLVVPAPNPAVSPSGQPLCPLKISGNAGLDYGNGLFVIAWAGGPLDTNAQLYAAGRYRPTLNELDCIGIIVLTHAPGRITFTFGHGYEQYYRSKPRLIRNGDVVEVGIGSARFATVVRF
jgi:hypothetical protein